MVTKCLLWLVAWMQRHVVAGKANCEQQQQSIRPRIRFLKGEFDCDGLVQVLSGCSACVGSQPSSFRWVL